MDPTTRRSALFTVLASPLLFSSDTPPVVKKAAPHAAPKAHAHAAAPKVSADDVLRELTAGNKRFATGHCKHPHTSLARLKETAPAQHPTSVILSCSDSRVPPEVLFDQGIGDVFAVRVAGNVANNDEVASVEYAVEHFGSPLCVVLGHTECGAVDAVVNGDQVPAAVQRLVTHIAEAVEKTRKHSPTLAGKELVAEAVRVNVWESVEDMLKTSESIALRVRTGALRVVGAVYHLDDGKVEWLGTYPGALSILR
jgi:carbonic anhydrase